jgi:glucokinase
MVTRAGTAAVVAVDVGGTRIKAAVVSQAGISGRELMRPTPTADGPDAVVTELVSVVTELIADPAGAEIAAVGVVVPGVVDPVTGRAEFSANLGFRDLPLRDIVAGGTGLPAVLGHDVTAAGLAERRVGLCAGIDEHLVAVIGTGIAAVIHSGGRTIGGSGGIAGELGHIPVWPGGERCSCGQQGCLERYASAAAVERRYRDRSGREGLTAHDVVALIATDDDARAAWDDATEALALALATCTMLLDPELIVLAGGLSEAGSTLLAPVRAKLADLIAWRDPPPVAVSPFGSRAGLLGAALLAWEAAGEHDHGGWRAKDWYSPIHDE